MPDIPLEQIDAFRYRIPRDESLGMRTDVVVYASAALMEQIRKDQSLTQAMNVATLPGIVGSSLAMPDIHQGYGFPIGGVAAMDMDYGVVSPGGVGFDINCGVRLVRSTLTESDVRPRLKQLIDQIFRDVPCGTGSHGRVKLKHGEIEDVLRDGTRWMISNGYGEDRDAEFAEAGGALEGALPNKVSARAKERGTPQLATLGSGNHFLEVQYVEELHDAAAAQAMRLEKGQVVVLIHSGSRGLGHQVCTDYVALMNQVMPSYKITLPDRQLACAPIRSEEGRSYLGAMAAAANFAWANRQGILHFLRGAFSRVFGEARLELIYDVCHNIAKRETYQVEGRSSRSARTSQGRNTGLSCRSSRDSGRLSFDRPARVRTGKHGNSILGARRPAARDRRDFRQRVSRRGTPAKPNRCSQRKRCASGAAEARRAGHPGAQRIARWHSGGIAGSLQERR